MCCIFTCCGWMIDLVQRLWTFTMSCCISSAVCCSFLTASMAGIALGYNYSLAEYIDLKETNVSVYIKRGVFDDEIADDMDWRRSGHLPVAGHIGEKNLITAAPEQDENLALRSGRRLDDSMFDSNDMNKFEGSLMKLTAKVPYATTTTKGVTSDQEMSDIISKYPLGSIDQLKAMQSLINMRKSGGVRDTTAKEMPMSSTFGFDERYLPHFPAFPNPMAGGRRQMPQNIRYETPAPPNAARKAVPDEGINEPAKWLYPKLPPGDPNKNMYGDYDSSFTYPPPVTPRAGPLRPTKTALRIFKPRPTASTTEKAAKTPPKGIELGVPKSIDRDLEEFKEKLTLGKYEGPEIKEEELMKMARGGPIKSEGEDYEEDIKGLPVRKRRQVDNIIKVDLIKSLSTNDTNSKGSPDQPLKLKSNNIKRSIFKSKFLIVSSELAKIPEMTATDSKMNDISKETVNKDQSIIPNDVTLGKLPSPKSLILNLLKSTVS